MAGEELKRISRTSEVRNRRRTQNDDYKMQNVRGGGRSWGWLPIIAAAGFIATGVLFYPYGITRDSQASFVTVYLGFSANESWVGLNNWMGWFVPSIWSGLRSLTGLNHVVGLLHNFLYWVAMPVLYRNLFPGSSNGRFFSAYSGWFVAFAFFPPVLLMLTSITNNVLLLSLIAVALAVLSFRLDTKRTWPVIAAMAVFLAAAFVRRDAVVFILPMVAALGLLLASRRWLGGVGAVAVFLLLFVGIDKVATSRIKDYAEAINSTEVIAIFDAVGMSDIRQEVLIPDDLLKPEYRDANRFRVLEQINAINVDGRRDLYNDHYFYHGFEVTERPFWTNGLNLAKALPVYLANWPTYLQFRAGYVWEKFTRVGWLTESAYFYPDLLDLMGVDAYPQLHPLVMKIQAGRVLAGKVIRTVFPFLLQLWFYLLLTVVCFFLLRRGSSSVPADVRAFLCLLLGVIWFAIAVLCVSSVVIQLRYPFAYAFFVWPVFVYLVRMRVMPRGGS